MGLRFTHDTLPQRVVFASFEAARHLADEVARLDASRVMVIAAEAESRLADQVVAGLPVAVRHSEVVMHVPADVADRARKAAEDHAVDVLVSVGGGSTTGLAKAVALTTGLPIVAVPTTYAGSRGDERLGLTEAGRKTTGVDARVLPRAVVYDAGAHAVPAGAAERRHRASTPWRTASTRCGRRASTRSTRRWRRRASARSGRAPRRGRAIPAASRAASRPCTAPTWPPWRSRRPAPACTTRSATCSAGCTTCRTRRRTPWCCRTCSPSTPRPSPRSSGGWPAAFGAPSALEGLRRLRSAVGAPRALRDYGLREGDIPAAVDAVLANVPPGNPRP